VMDHLVHGDAERVGAAHDDVAARVADQDDVDAALVEDFCRGIVVRGEDRDFFAGLFAGF
jgi:cytochrome c551/c552